MPTPGGLLKTGDRVRHIESDTVAVVVKRESNDALYSVILRAADGSGQPVGTRPPYGWPQGTWRLLEAAWWMDHGWEVLP